MKDTECIMSVNNKLIIKENAIDYACGEIGNIIENKLRDLFNEKADDIDVEVSFDDECCDDEYIHFWKEIDIILLNNKSKDEDVIGVVTYTTNDHEPQLVYVDGKFVFYYVFDQTGNTCTNPFDMKNIGVTIYPCERCLEQILIDELVECFKQE